MGAIIAQWQELSIVTMRKVAFPFSCASLRCVFMGRFAGSVDFVALAVMGAMACGPADRGVRDCGGQFAVDPTFSPEDVETIRRGMARFSAWSGEHVELAGQTTSLDWCAIAKTSLPLAEKGAYFSDTGVMWLDLANWGGSEEGRQRTVMHEVGHSFGLAHLAAGKAGIMGAQREGSEVRYDFTADDADDCRVVGHCMHMP
jgi:hypothetical protein